MIIGKVINNNVVLSKDEDGKIVVIMGKGVGFGKKPGALIPENKIEKKFYLEDKSQTDRFTELIADIPRDHLKVSMELIDYARTHISRNLSTSIYISLTDHINFALDRMKQNMMFQHPLLNEVRTFYPSEYLVGEYGLELIRKQLGVKLPVDEAASIAMHLVNAEYNMNMSTTMKMTNLVGDCMEIVSRELQMELDEKSLSCSRFVTHVKFMAQRIFSDQMLDEGDELTEMIIGKYPEEYEISRKIAEHIQTLSESKITEDEQAYLTIHIRRLHQDMLERNNG